MIANDLLVCWKFALVFWAGLSFNVFVLCSRTLSPEVCLDMFPLRSGAWLLLFCKVNDINLTCSPVCMFGIVESLNTSNHTHLPRASFSTEPHRRCICVTTTKRKDMKDKEMFQLHRN